jgi:glycosyltransferase involved in cell wall biosynthesis
VSIVIKVLNEEEMIDKCLASALEATRGISSEVVVADSLSTDRSVEKAAVYPVGIVQLVDGSMRSCGAAAQLGYQGCSGEYIYILDGDMILDGDFLRRAIEMLDSDEGLAGVAGRNPEMSGSNAVFQRQANTPVKCGPVTHLSGGGLYRRLAIEQVGYLSNRNLHAMEELELGLRLSAKGWRLERIDAVAARHYGYSDDNTGLIVRRLRSKYVDGYGELLRGAWNKPYLPKVLRSCKFPLAILGLLFVSLVLLVTGYRWPVLALWLGLIAVMTVKKRSLKEAVFSIAYWHAEAFGLLRGIIARQVDPRSPIPSVRLQ